MQTTARCRTIENDAIILTQAINNILEDILKIKNTSNISTWLGSIDMTIEKIDMLLEAYENSKNKEILNYIVPNIISVLLAVRAYIENKVNGESPTRFFSNSIRYLSRSYKSSLPFQENLHAYRLMYLFLKEYEKLRDTLELLKCGSISFHGYLNRLEKMEIKCPRQAMVATHNFFRTLLTEISNRIPSVYRGLWQKIIRKIKQVYAEAAALIFLYDFILASRQLKENDRGELKIINANPCFSIWIKKKILKPLSTIEISFRVLRRNNSAFLPKLEIPIEFMYGSDIRVEKTLVFPEINISQESLISLLSVIVSRYPNKNELSFFAHLQDNTLSKILQFRTKLEKFEPEIIQEYIKDITEILTKRNSFYEELIETTNNLTTYVWPSNIQHLVEIYFKSNPSGQIILILPLDDTLLHMIPWELIPINSTLLSLKIPIIRQIAWEIPYGYNFEYAVRHPEEKISMLLLGNLTGDLPQAETELTDIANLALSEINAGLFDSIYRISYTDITFKSAKKYENIRKMIDSALKRRVSIIHIATHMDIDDQGVYIPILTEKQINKYAIFDLFRRIGISNTILFINSCMARGETLSEDALYQLLSALSKFPDAISAVIFPINKIFDSTAKMFSTMFYRELFRGTEFSRCLYIARKQMLMSHKNRKISDLNWLSYISYGNPYFSLRRSHI